MNSTALKERLIRKEALLEKAYALQDKLLDSAKDTASMDTGDGRVMFKNRSLEEVEKTVSRLESDIKKLEQQLAKTGVTGVSLRRHC